MVGPSPFTCVSQQAHAHIRAHARTHGHTHTRTRARTRTGTHTAGGAAEMAERVGGRPPWGGGKRTGVSSPSAHFKKLHVATHAYDLVSCVSICGGDRRMAGTPWPLST